MNKEQVFKLLTEDYSLILATSETDREAIIEIRKNTLLEKYNSFTSIEDEKSFLYSEDDKQAFIYYLRDNINSKNIGTLRVYFVNDKCKQSFIPMERYSDSKIIDELKQPYPVCEYSRMGLILDINAHCNFSTMQLRMLLVSTLLIGARINILLYPYNVVFAVMENSLNRMLKRQGVHFSKIGDEIDYYGICTPYAIERKKLLSESSTNLWDVTRFYLKQLCQNPDKLWEFVDNNPYLERSDIQLDRICKLFEEYGDDVDVNLLIGEDLVK